jgi:long-chain acyl-CoA synthetase
MSIFDHIKDNVVVRFIQKTVQRLYRPSTMLPSVFDQKPWLAFYDDSVPAEINLPAITLNDFFQTCVKDYASKTALIYFGREISYGRLGEFIEKFTAGLAESGIQKGDRIALILPNLPQFIIAYWAALLRGAVLVPMNPLCSAKEVEVLLSVCRPKMIITFDRLYERLHQVFENANKVQIVLTSISTFMPAMTRMLYFFRGGFKLGVRTLSEGHTKAFSRLFIESKAPPKPMVTADDDALLLFTGGVTGIPKAVLLRHKNLVANTLQTQAWLNIKKDRQAVILALLPLFHSYGMTACHHLAFSTAAILILEPRFKAARAVHLIQKYKATIFAGVPTMYRAVLNLLQEKNKRLRCSCICVSGGAPLPVDLKADFEKFTTVRLIEGYGLTEAAPITHCNPIMNSDRHGSIGLPYPNTEARIVDLKNRRPMAVGEIGELQVRGPQVMSGYFENDSETRVVLTPDGWLNTGDLAEMDKDGFFYIVDRKKDLILYGGLNIYPSEIESVLDQHPCVAESAVVGIPDDYYGEVVKAFVKRRDASVCGAEEILSFCRDKLAPYKLPKSIEFVNHLPKNFIGKVIRRKLVENISAEQG